MTLGKGLGRATTAKEPSTYTASVLRREGRRLLEPIIESRSLAVARRRLMRQVLNSHSALLMRHRKAPSHVLATSRDCAGALIQVLHRHSDSCSGFSVARALWDIARRRIRPDLGEGFYAEIIHWIRGLEGRAELEMLINAAPAADLTGRPAAIARSGELDVLWEKVQSRMDRYEDGLGEQAVERRSRRRKRVLEVLGGRSKDWDDWHWHVNHLVMDERTLNRLVDLPSLQGQAIRQALDGRLPFAITPYYASLMDDRPSDRDRAVRMQVLPPTRYVQRMLACRGDMREFDFMRETDTSPTDRITRRYPAIVILKPYNTCPQICVYCQRNWEITQALDPDAQAPRQELERAIRWIARHPAIREVLITGGDPMLMEDADLGWLIEGLSRIDHVDLIRIGTRTPVTLPMRITPQTAALLGSFRCPGRRELVVMTHVEHPYEITPELAGAVDRLRRQGIGVYNQQVYTLFTSRRFETAKLRLLLRRCGIDPYYSFVPKGKEETADYRVPIARLLQERKEEARLLPGSRRTDEMVYNVPGLGKNYLRATQHRDLVSLTPEGQRVYEFHPWEKNIVQRHGYLMTDVALLDYLRRLEELGEDSADYGSIWYYF